MAKIFVITKDYCDYEGLGELSRQEIKAAATLEDAKTIAKQMWKEEEDWVGFSGGSVEKTQHSKQTCIEKPEKVFHVVGGGAGGQIRLIIIIFFFFFCFG